jgi:hypothetical protein
MKIAAAISPELRRDVIAVCARVVSQELLSPIPLVLDVELQKTPLMMMGWRYERVAT